MAAAPLIGPDLRAVSPETSEIRGGQGAVGAGRDTLGAHSSGPRATRRKPTRRQPGSSPVPA
ncbi:hypothetical protein GCM10018785_48070 [Streptomyces longispororuber]|uniref:Uncharacterized protein n=1 Tax=Streptomyces longispororuber TaxID=68230 RepID=A0A919DSZ3_9ACTN|nr:hypothetical protein GCM10018785_48070 [Streptomyces longispororuber]